MPNFVSLVLYDMCIFVAHYLTQIFLPHVDPAEFHQNTVAAAELVEV
jgi:hypothetical protein